MASKFKTYSDEKLFGVVYTPNFVVCKILDAIDYNGWRIEGKSIIDPACGDGAFLVEAARRIIYNSTADTLVSNLECIYGWDIDPQAVEKCIENLNALLPAEVVVKWNVEVCDSLTRRTKAGMCFDYVVTNPPYVRIQHLDQEQRQYIQQNYNFCKNGNTDIYIAFFELCLNLLSPTGICGLITPNTYLHTEAGKELRWFFEQNRNLIQITDYGSIQLFDNVTTYSAITVFCAKRRTYFQFQKATSKTDFKEKFIACCDLKEPWQLSADKEKVKYNKVLKDVCDIHVGLTTLCDKAYIFHVDKTPDIEQQLLRPCIKASKYKGGPVTENILFPYVLKDGKACCIPEAEMKLKYPKGYAYLLSVKERLDKRDGGKPNKVAWYAYGRSQGLVTSFGEKILFSPMNKYPNFIYSSENACFYSGYCLKNFKGVTVEWLLEQLNSARMQDYIQTAGRDFRGGWKSYNKRAVENFPIMLK